MAQTDRGKVYVVDTSVLVSAPDALPHLADGNTVVIPFPVLQELDRRALPLIGVHLHEAGSRVVVDGDVGELPAGTVD